MPNLLLLLKELLLKDTVK